MRRAFVIAAAGAAALLFVAAARAAAYAPEAARSAARLPPEQREERAVLRSMAATARFEAEACRLALARSASAGLKAWAAELLSQHDAGNTELVHLLHSRGMALPMLENDQRKALARLGRLSGTAFDREFREAVPLRHKARAQQLEKAQLAVADPLLKAWIGRQLAGLANQQAVAGTGVRAGLRPSLVSGSSSR